MSKPFRSFLRYMLHPVMNRIRYKKISSPGTNVYDKNILLNNFYSVLKQIDFIPKHIVDVGANHGTWTREALKYFPAAYYTLLEPQQQMKESIKDILQTNPKVNFHAIGAGNTDGTFLFTIVERDDSCSFLYTKDEAKAKGYAQVEVPVVMLNTFLPKINLPNPDIIKIDAEGLDIKVLEGANSFFGVTEIFMVEAGVMNKSIDNNVLKVISYMDEKGYRLFDITDLNRTFKNNALWLVELVFIKKEGVIDNAINSYA